MVILPIAHERQTVQRLPWITFALIAINILIHIFVSIGSDSFDESAPEEAGQFFEYLSQHPYLDIPESMMPFVDESDRETLELMRESFDDPDPEILEEEQAELDRLAASFQDWMNRNPLRKYGYIPADPKLLSLFTCMFLHTGFFHLFGNMLFLYLAGCSLEDLWGRPLYTAFYFLSGIAATLVHHLSFPESPVPIVGASGAIAGLMGAFLFRLARTKIRFLYIFWVLLAPIKMGTFEAPAYIMLPLWLLQQLLYAAISDESAGVAFWAHIGGFLFGFSFAAAMKSLNIEEKYIAPRIEQQVSLKQNPLFLKAIESIEKRDLPSAVMLLNKVVAQEPDHVEAFMELRRIAEITQDKNGYRNHTAAMLERFIRNKDTDLVLETYNQYKESPLKTFLPARTSFALAVFFEDQADYPSALNEYNQFVLKHEMDPLSLKAYGRMARIYFEHLSDREKAADCIRSAMDHPMASDSWRTAMQSELKKYGVPNQGL